MNKVENNSHVTCECNHLTSFTSIKVSGYVVYVYIFQMLHLSSFEHLKMIDEACLRDTVGWHSYKKSFIIFNVFVSYALLHVYCI